MPQQRCTRQAAAAATAAAAAAVGTPSRRCLLALDFAPEPRWPLAPACRADRSNYDEDGDPLSEWGTYGAAQGRLRMRGCHCTPPALQPARPQPAQPHASASHPAPPHRRQGHGQHRAAGADLQGHAAPAAAAAGARVRGSRRSVCWLQAGWRQLLQATWPAGTGAAAKVPSPGCTAAPLPVVAPPLPRAASRFPSPIQPWTSPAAADLPPARSWTCSRRSG